MRKLLNLIILTLLLVTPSLALLKDLTVNGDKVAFDKVQHRLEAEGSVEVTYQELLVRGQHLVYDTSTEVLDLDRGFTMFYEGITFEGATLNYLIPSKQGRATRVGFYYEGMEMGGENLALDPEKLQLKNSHFTTCDDQPPHYQVTAADLNLYPKYGWLVAYWGLFWLGRLPVVPMPTYIYDFKAADKAKRNLPPFPEIGSNADDGSYISERLAWHLNRNLSGTYSLNYAANKGVGGGVATDYLLNDNNEGDFRINWNGQDGFFGGLTHDYSFGGEVGTSNQSNIFFLLPRTRQYRLATTISNRERINYQRVSFLPDIQLETHSGELLRKEAKYDFSLSAGQVKEEGNVRLVRGAGVFKLFGDFQETPYGLITPSLVLDGSFYSNGTQWLKPSVGLALKRNFPLETVFGLEYIHYLLIAGQSPFNYEMYHYRPADRLRSGLMFAIGETQARIGASYFLDNWSPEDIDYTLFFKLHCYNLGITWRSLRQEFAVGFSLAEK